MTTVMLLGDVHGDRGFTRNAIRWAAENNVDRIVQVGDFGFWPRTNPGRTFLHDVGKLSVNLHVPLYFIDGNHEDHDMLDTLPRAASGFAHYGKYPVTYIPRGTRWEWDGVWFGAFGGAFSIDRYHRVKCGAQYGWFPQEMPNPDVIQDLGKVDVLLTHDSPIVPPVMYGTGFKHDETSRLSQSTVYDALVSSGASLLVHGHWHLNQQYLAAGAVIQGLAMNHDSLYDAAVVFHTGDRKLYTLRQWEYLDEETRTLD
jgi:hypothetical protein